MGVAVNVSTSTFFLSSFNFSLCLTPKRCSSSITSNPKSEKATSADRRRCVPIIISICPFLNSSRTHKNITTILDLVNLFFKRAIIVALSVIVLNVPSKLHAEALNPGNNKVCIDPGHQAKGNKGLEEVAPGSSTKKIKVADGTAGVVTKKPEYQLTLEVGLKLRDRLKSKGYPVFMIRETNNVNISNKERAIMTNKEGCAVYIRLHADGSSNRSLNGVSVLTSSPKNPHTKNVQKSSDKFSKDVLSEFVKATGAKNRGVSYRDDLTGTNWSTVTNTLIEMGFMSNPEEDRKMASDEYQNKMVTGIVNGIEKYFREK